MIPCVFTRDTTKRLIGGSYSDPTTPRYQNGAGNRPHPARADIQPLVDLSVELEAGNVRQQMAQGLEIIF